MGIIDERFINKEDLLEDLLPDIKEALMPQFMESLMPVGFGYIQFGDSPLPGDTLYNQEDGLITEDFTATELSSCVFAGTTWKLAVRAGDFLRQVGSRTNEDELEISAAEFGESQEDQFQGHTHGLNIVTVSSGSGASVAQAESLSGRVTSVAITDEENGTPRTGVETRPVNTAVRFWVRVA